MQFTSYSFIFLFLPLFVPAYFLCNRISRFTGKLIIIVSGLLFYFFACTDSASSGDTVQIRILSLAVFGASILTNAALSLLLSKTQKRRKPLLILAVILNAAGLFYFKYRNFAVSSINSILKTGLEPKEILLPLAISFFTFQQIMYVVSVYRGEISQVGITDYLAYILYFPKILMGPLIEPKDFTTQLNDPSLKKFRWENLASGIKMFSFGLFKKIVLADTFARAVTWGFTQRDAVTSGDLLIVMLCYMFEIYFDFSGYSDMAVGVSWMVNITLPINFNSPYKAVSIRDFWKRWHISLTNFLTKYVYIPLGGSRKGKVRTCINIMLVFLVSGLWHGAEWTFILWGVLHGLLMVLERIFSKPEHQQRNHGVKWIGTMLAISFLWLLFRSVSVEQYLVMLEKIFCFKNMAVTKELLQQFVLPETPFFFETLGLTGLDNSVRGLSAAIFLISSALLCLIPENNYINRDRIGPGSMILCAVAFVWAFLCLSSESVFVYFNF